MGRRRDAGDELDDDAKSGGWAQSGSLTTYNRTKQVSMQANFPKADNYTVQFGLSPLPETDDPIEILAKVTWSVEGNSVSRLVSVTNGMSIMGTGQGVKVEVSDNTQHIFPVVIGEKDYVVSIQCAPGTRGNIQQPPTLSVFPDGDTIFNVGPATIVDVEIPDNAGVVSLAVTVSEAGSPSVGVPDGKTQVIHINGAGIMKVYNPRDYEWVPIAAGATKIRLVNNFTLVEGNHLLYTVTFGIDG